LPQKGGFIYFEQMTRRMHHWYRNMQSLRSLPLKKVGRRGLPEPIPPTASLSPPTFEWLDWYNKQKQVTA